MKVESINQVDSVINAMIDEFIVCRKKPKFSFYKYLVSENIDRKTITSFLENSNPYTNISTEICDVNKALDGTDPDLKEAYGHFRKPELRDYRDMLQQIIEDAVQYKETKRIVRKRKAAPPERQVKNLKYYEDTYSLGNLELSSVDPASIIGKKILCFYNTKTNELTVIYSKGITVKGTTIIEFDEDKSWVKKIRNPIPIIGRVMNPVISKTTLDDLKNSINTQAKAPTGRINEHCILLRVI